MYYMFESTNGALKFDCNIFLNLPTFIKSSLCVGYIDNNKMNNFSPSIC